MKKIGKIPSLKEKLRLEKYAAAILAGLASDKAMIKLVAGPRYSLPEMHDKLAQEALLMAQALIKAVNEEG